MSQEFADFVRDELAYGNASWQMQDMPRSLIKKKDACKQSRPVMDPVQKRVYSTPMEFQSRKGRNDSLKLKIKEYLKKEKTETRKKTNGQLPCRSYLHELRQTLGWLSLTCI